METCGSIQVSPSSITFQYLPHPFFSFLDIVFSISHNLFQSMSKPRSLGFTGYIDTEESFYAIFERMQRDGVFPKGLPGREAGRAAFRY